jgi:magnesium-transporting ATPase (P-type)
MMGLIMTGNNDFLRIDRAWHALPAIDALRELGADAAVGLPEAEVERRRAGAGPNRITPASARSPFARFASQFNNLFIYLLIAAGIVTGLLGEWLDSGVIFGVVVLIAVIGFVQEGRAERALESVRSILSNDASVRRDGRRRKIGAEELVPGDVVHLEAGDPVPADLRLLKRRNLQTRRPR